MEDLVKVENEFKKWKEKFKKAPLTTVVLFLMSLSSLGISGYFYTKYKEIADNVVHTTIEDPNTKSYKAFVHITDSVARVVAAEETQKLKMDDIFKNMDTYGKLAIAFTGWHGMTDEESAEYVKEKFLWSDSIQKRSPQIQAIHEWVEMKMGEDGNIEKKYVDCGYVKYNLRTDKLYFVDCDDEQTLRRIRYGRPSGVNLNSNRNVFYYRNIDDKVIIISSLSNY